MGSLFERILFLTNFVALVTTLKSLGKLWMHLSMTSRSGTIVDH